MFTNKCNAPCVINTAIGFQLVLCEKEHSHMESHSVELKGNKETIVSWVYIGQPTDGGVSGTPALHEHCDSSTRVKLPPQLAPGVLEPMYKMSLMTVTESPTATTGFNCEREHGHKGCHMRSGVFGPLGIAWKIEW